MHHRRDRSADAKHQGLLPAAQQAICAYRRSTRRCATDCSRRLRGDAQLRSEEHTSELQSLMRISYAVFCLQKKTNTKYKSFKDNIMQYYNIKNNTLSRT